MIREGSYGRLAAAGQETYLTGVNLIKVRFPQFWRRAYREKDRFYEKVRRTEEGTLDITGDGEINNKDLTRLFRYLSGYPVEIQ